MKRNFIEAAMAYHKIVLLIVSMFVIIGIYGLCMMPKQEIPSITIRQGLVAVVYPGATSAEVEARVARTLEDFVFGYKEVNKKKSYTLSKDGMALMFLELNDNVNNHDAFWSKFKHGLSGLKTQLPSGVLAVQAIDDVGDTSSLLITLESNQKTYRELRKYLESLEDKLRRIDAVSRLRVSGMLDEQISVYLDSKKMARYGIGAYSVLSKLSMQGFTTLSGTVKNDDGVLPVHVADSYDTEREVGEQIVYSDKDGNIVRLKDVARVVREYPDTDKYIQCNGTKCVLLSVEMREGYDIVAMGKEVHQLLDEYKKTLPDDVNITTITDQAKVVEDSVINFLRELLIAVVSVIVVVILLMPLRVAGVSAISIPVTIFMALALFCIFGIELNTVTLAALIVTLGMIVDDSVVIIDNYIDKLGTGMSRWHAASAAPREFFMSVLSATLSISITFFPFLFTMTGPYGDFVKSFPWSMFIILGISLLISLLVTPYLQYVFIKKGITPKQDADGKKKKSPLDYLQAGYDALLAACFRHPMLTIGAGVASIVLGVLIYLSIPQRMMPIADRDQFAVEFYLPAGASSQRTAAVADSLRHILEKDERVVSITSFIGEGSPRFHSTYAPQVGGPNFAQFIVNTKGEEETEQLLDEYADRYTEYFADAHVRFKQMDYSDAIYPIEVRLSGDSISDLLKAAQIVEQTMHANKGLKMIRTNYENVQPGIMVRPDEVEAERLGVNKALLSADLAVGFGDGVPMTTLWEKDYPVSVVLKSEHNGKPNADDLLNEYIPVLGGMSAVPLRQLASVTPDWNPGTIVRRNGVRTISVTAEVYRGNNENVLTQEVWKAIPFDKLPAGVEASLGGMYEKDNETIPMVVNGVVIAVMLIFFILLFHFKRIDLALINLGSITLCVFGSMAGLKLLGMNMSLTAILGLVSLMGILVRNGIIMLDYAEELRRDMGMSVRDAAYHAGVRRMRPIFLTSAAASVGVLPMILENSSLWTPMGTVICFGTLISMVLISTVLPVMYWLAFRGKVK